MTQCYSLTSLMTWAGVREVNYFKGDMKLPYVHKDGLFWYFGQREDGYHLLMSSVQDLEEME